MIRHRPSHWIAVALVLLAALFVYREVHGQMRTGSEAMFEGRPSLAGAQAGLGAQAGPPQGGLGVEGNEGMGLRLRPPSGLNEPRAMPQGTLDSTIVETVVDAERPVRPRGDRRLAQRDRGLAQDTGSTTRSAARTVRRQADRVRFPGVAMFDAR